MDLQLSPYNPNRNEFMKIKLILINIIFLIITIQSLYCQTDCCCNSTDKSNYERELSGELFALTLDTITWFNKDWTSGDIYLSDGEIIRNKQIKYNGLLDELFWLEPKSGKTIKLDKEAILKFHFLNLRGDTSVYFRKLKIKRYILTDPSEVFVQEIYNGKLSLFVFHTFFVERREIVAKNNVYFEREIYEEKPGYFLSFTNNRTIGLESLTRKNLYILIPDKKEQIKQFFKLARKVKIETYPHMVLLMKFLNSVAD